MHSKDQKKYEFWREKLEYYCSYQERCIYDIELKIKKLNIPLSLSIKLIGHLKEQNFVNNERYALSLVRSKMETKRDGKTKIAYFLKSKRIEETYIEKALNLIDLDTYQKNLLQVTENKMTVLSKKHSGHELKSRMIRYLLGKGYKYDEINDALNQLSKNN